jgi:hypothetical protein
VLTRLVGTVPEGSLGDFTECLGLFKEMLQLHRTEAAANKVHQHRTVEMLLAG